MSLTPGEARSALEEIEKTVGRSAAAQHAHYAAPHFFIWGVVWTVGYLVMAVRPDLSWLWLPLGVAGIAASFFVTRRSYSPGRVGPGFSWRYVATIALVYMFIFATYAVLRPTEANQYSAFSPLLGGFGYALVGIWSKGWRFLPLGLALIGLTLIGYFWLPDYFSYWMAAVGGGGLILGGLWMRSV